MSQTKKNTVITKIDWLFILCEFNFNDMIFYFEKSHMYTLRASNCWLSLM